MILFGKKFKKWLIGTLLPIAFTINSCDHSYIDGLNNIQPYKYSPVVAAPLINSSLGIDDIIGSANFDGVHIDEEGLVWLFYRGSVPAVTPFDIILLTDQAESFAFSLAPATYAQPQTMEHDFHFQIGNNVELNSVTFLTGALNIEIISPELVAAGYTLSSTFEVVGSNSGIAGQPIRGTSSLITPSVVDLTGSTLAINQPGNQLIIRHTFTLSGAGNPAAGPFNVTVNQSFRDLQYDIATGYMGTRSFPMGGTTITLAIFENLGLEQTTFEAPRIEVLGSNSYGVPFDISVSQFLARNTDNNRMSNINLPAVYNPWRLTQATAPGDTSTTLGILTHGNSNLRDIAAINPNQIIYEVIGTINPEGRQLNFVRHNSSLNLDLAIYVPMWARVERFEIDDTIRNPIDTIPQSVEWVEMNINIDNGIPIEASLQVYFADSIGNKIDTLFLPGATNNLIGPAPADPNTGIANDVRHTNMRIMLSQNQIESLRNTRNFILVADLRTYNQQGGQFVKILDANKLDIWIGVRIKAAIELDL